MAAYINEASPANPEGTELERAAFDIITELVVFIKDK